MKLIAFLAHWLGRQFLSLLMIVAVLMIGSYLYRAVQHHAELLQERESLRSNQEALANTWLQVSSDTEKRVQTINTKSQKEINERIRSINSEIAQEESLLRSGAERKLALLRGETKDIEREIRIDLLKQELRHLEIANAVLDRATAITKGNAHLRLLKNRYLRSYRELQETQNQIDTLTLANPLQHRIPLSPSWQEIQFLKTREAGLLQQNQQADQTYQQHARFLKALQDGPTELPPFTPTMGARKTLENELQKNIGERSAELASTWIGRFINPALDVLPTALGILLATIFSPLAIKAFFYYLVAPLAARCQPVCLRPDNGGILNATNGIDGCGGKVSCKTLTVRLRANEELMIHPEYLRSMSIDSIKSTQFLLDKNYPLTSLASGLYLLTRLRAATPHSHVISAKEDILAEIAQIEIPLGSRLVLQPRSLIGVIQSTDQPLQIESQWRLGSISAWLTLQLRYLIFSAPTKLLVIGCQGVRIDSVGNGQSVNQAATIGFSGNLAYSVTRCDPFVAYLRGKQELFNDHFTGASGYYVSEETPNAGKKGGLAGKGLEGLADSVLKVFGI